MADTQEIILEINTQTSIDNIAKLRKEQDALKESNANLQEQLEKNVITYDEYNKAIEKNNSENIKNAILVNTLGTILTTNSVVYQMKKQKCGRIINIISQAGLYGKAERSVYNASKWAITGFTKSIQLELAPFGISVVGFYPGFIHTNLFGKARTHKTDFSTAMPVEKPAKALAYLIEVDSDIVIKEFGIQSIKQF